MKDHFSAARGRVHAFSQALKTNLAPLKRIDRFDRMLERTTEAVQFPDHQGVSIPCVFDGLRQTLTGIETITPLNSFNSPVGFNWLSPVWPAGLTPSFTNANPTSTGITISFSAPSYTTVGTYTFVLGRTSGSLSHGATIAITITRTADFSVFATPSVLTVGNGGTAASTISVSGAYNKAA